jgi:hypothetical protein
LQFENYLGDLEKLSLVEKKQQEFNEQQQQQQQQQTPKANTTLSQQQQDERHTLLLIDRFKFLNLYPCNSVELKSIGYKEANNLQSTAAGIGLANCSSALTGTLSAAVSKVTSSPSPPSSPTVDDASNNSNGHKDKKHIFEKCRSANPFNSQMLTRTRFPTPDLAKMYPFKPNRSGTITSSLQPIPGCGLFMFPSIFADLIKRLPPPSSFNVNKFLQKSLFNFKKLMIYTFLFV